MTPTQAQVEAAAKAIEKLSATDPIIDVSFADIAAAALTAAAEAGEQPKYDDGLVRRIVDAAEMSEEDTKELFLEAADALVGWSSANRKMKTATIERCAQVVAHLAENCPPHSREQERLGDAISAIRAMKEEG